MDQPINLIVAGVGGQGNVLASRIIALAAVQEGYEVSVGETFGASQRGGSVMSHVRITRGEKVGPLIPYGKADLVVALESMECLRVLRLFGNKETRAIMNEYSMYPLKVLKGEAGYPPLENLKSEIGKQAVLLLSFSATTLAMAVGRAVAANVVMVGALAGINLLPFGPEKYRLVIEDLFTGTGRDLNLALFDRGVARGREALAG